MTMECLSPFDRWESDCCASEYPTASKDLYDTRPAREWRDRSCRPSRLITMTGLLIATSGAADRNECSVADRFHFSKGLRPSAGRATGHREGLDASFLTSAEESG
jgi:hypothetical protein